MMRAMRLTLGDAFNRRRSLAGGLASWTNRLEASGVTLRTFRCAAIDRANKTELVDP